MSANKEAASSSSSGDAQAEKAMDKLNVREFRERFCILNGVLVKLMDGEVMTIEKSEDNAIFFTNEQFNAGLQFPSRRCSRNFFTSPRFLRLTSIPIWSGC